MFQTKRIHVARPDDGRISEGTRRMMAHLKQQRARSIVPRFGLTLWAATCPGSFYRLWNADLQAPADEADDAFAPTVSMGLHGI
ncbi:MAG: hypothetical protein JWQ76_680 [Ramlibacter sp.]|nr:hypothetical protein [Ramlibacter sp.]